MTQPQAATTEAGDPYCPSCGYNLRGLASDRCPECGIAVDWQALERSVIPWNYRKRMGAWRGFWRTVFLVSRHPLAIARDISRPVSYGDAQKFRWLVVLVAWLPMCGFVIVGRALLGDIPYPGLEWYFRGNIVKLPATFDLLASMWAGAFIWPVPSISLLLCVAAITGVHSLFFHPRALNMVQQNRAVALSFYACAPLVMLFIPCILLAGAIFVSKLGLGEHGFGLQVFHILIIVGCAGLPILLAIFWVRTLFLLKQSTYCGRVRVVSMAISLPVIWLILMFLMLFIVPSICGMVKLMIYSFL